MQSKAALAFALALTVQTSSIAPPAGSDVEGRRHGTAIDKYNAAGNISYTAPLSSAEVFNLALAQAPIGVQAIAKMIEGAEMNPEARIQIIWGGEGINCDGIFACERPIGNMTEYRSLLRDIDLNRLYWNQENIACLNSDICDGTTCMFLEDTTRPVSGA